MADSGAENLAVERLRMMLHCDEAQARFLLEAAGGNLDLALQMALENSDAGFGTNPPPQPHPHPGPGPGAAGPTPPRPRAPGARAPPVHVGGHHAGPGLLAAPLALLGLVLRVPLMAVSFGYGLMRGTIVTGAHVAMIVGDRVLPAPVMRGVRSAATAAAAALGGGPDVDPAGQAAAFVGRFKAAYGDRHPRWQEAGWRVALQQARREFRFLFVYLHSPEHEDTDAFCRGVLTSPDVVDYVNANFVSWAGDVTASDAFVLSQKPFMLLSRFPYVALLSMSPDNRVANAACGSGPDVATPEQLLTLLGLAVAEHGVMLAAQRAEVEERELARRLVEEQDAEYEASLAADRQREAEREVERRRQEEEERQRLAEEQRAREAAEAEARRVAEAEAAIARRRAAAQAALLPEPPAGSPGSAAIRLRLPDGTNTSRTFPEGSTLQAVFDYVDSLDATAYHRYHLVANYPRRVFLRTPHGPSPLQELGLVPQAALFVQPDE